MAAEPSTGPLPAYDLVVVGATPAGLSLASAAAAAGLSRVMVLETGGRVPIADAVAHHRIDLRYVERIDTIGRTPDGSLAITSPEVITLARVCVVADLGAGRPVPPDLALPESLAGRLHVDLGDWVSGDTDVLVIGRGERAVEITEALVSAGASTVLCFPHHRRDSLAPLSRSRLRHHETERRLTILWRSMPDEVADIEGFPMAFFADRSTPDLQVDHVVFALGAEIDPRALEFSLETSELAGLYLMADAVTTWTEQPMLEILQVRDAWEVVAQRHFADRLAAPPPPPRRTDDELRAEFYNATITRFDRTHGDLWILRVAPDDGEVRHRPGQYATLGLGHWEPRIDDAVDRHAVARRDQLIRRSYSISSPIFDPDGYLAPVDHELEFYIVRVPPGGDRVPAMTPRLATRAAGDRIYLGPRISGRYTLAPLRDPFASVLFIATGTGEAPHNAMLTELCRKGHQGPVMSVVTVRHHDDLGYLAAHRELERRYPNYHYLPIVTRDPSVQRKRYVQDLLGEGEIEEVLGAELDPKRSHVFLCGNPAMIGLPEWRAGGPLFPETRGVAEMLHERGFTLSRRSQVGNVHFEEYW